jgi:hypothetical protein
MPVPSNLDPTYSYVFRGARLVSEAIADPSAWREPLALIKEASVQRLAEQLRRDEDARKALFDHADLLAPFRKVSDVVRACDDLFAKQLISPSAIAFAQTQARLAQSVALPPVLEQYRTATEPLSVKLLALDVLGVGHMERHLEAFTQTSAVSDLIGQSQRVDSDLLSATRAFSLSSVPAFETLAGYRSFLDAAGLSLPRWPKFRLLTAAEKRRRFKARLQRKAEPPHFKKAKSLVHRYELMLREILDAVMADRYGEDWAEVRLPLCGCKGLLGRWRNGGGDVLDHADYAHYAQIMSHPEHFSAIFEVGFDDPKALAALLNAAGRLRAASHHARAFTPEDLRELRVIWRTIETGLLAFTADFEVEV